MDKINREMQDPFAHRALEQKEEGEKRPELFVYMMKEMEVKLNKLIETGEINEQEGIGKSATELANNIFMEEGRGIENLSIEEIKVLVEKLQIPYDEKALLVVALALEKEREKKPH